MTLVSFGELDRSRLANLAPNALLIVPVGATEQHGPALPTMTDSLHVEHVAYAAGRIAGETMDVVVAPTVAYGCSQHHLPFGATLSLSSTSLLSMLLDLGESAVASGFRKIFFLNGHGGNQEIVELAARDTSLSRSCHCGGGSWWKMAYDDLISAGADAHGRVPGHAGAFEAAAVLALRPDLIRQPNPPDPSRQDAKKLAAPYRAEFHGFWTAIDGYSDDPTYGDPDDGRRWLEVAAVAVARHLVEFAKTARTIDDLSGTR